MAKIISKRGQKQSSKEARETSTENYIYIIEIADFTPTPAELDHIKKVFDGIRKQLNDIENLP